MALANCRQSPWVFGIDILSKMCHGSRIILLQIGPALVIELHTSVSNSWPIWALIGSCSEFWADVSGRAFVYLKISITSPRVTSGVWTATETCTCFLLQTSTKGGLYSPPHVLISADQQGHCSDQHWSASAFLFPQPIWLERGSAMARSDLFSTDQCTQRWITEIEVCTEWHWVMLNRTEFHISRAE